MIARTALGALCDGEYGRLLGVGRDQRHMQGWLGDCFEEIFANSLIQLLLTRFRNARVR
ncbi:uncharacterized protein BCR38DRAFT_427475 [Pseudomassariella vexata]|uniref:Uncharacterized protein n=1 Tax=Pseudomassariella vexata TaxID=1141098 RepID=A0A1Y2E8F2_9PEZI|nr:uncharacterized protein BCR38DRAFT_427475 [Pseudomassariella vexata]ORY67556.1 hypothetical protein BCR38DRAFT_427475 [Pseudomassariella vexata]